MREVVFAIEFRGKAGPVPGKTGARQARTAASGPSVTPFIGGDWLSARVRSSAAEVAVLQASVQRFDDGTFVEEGTIDYGAAGILRFETLGRGWVAPSPSPGSMAGGVLWGVTGGDKEFEGARGLITSNFTVSADGDVVDDHVVRLYLP